LRLSATYIFIACLFGLWIWHELGFESYAEYMTGFLVEKSLSLDNIFIISLIFSSLCIPLKYQHRVLFFGILGAIVLRGLMIALGAHLLENFSWIIYIFSAFMILTGIKMFFIPQKEVDINDNRLLKWMRRRLRITEELYDQKFMIQLVNAKTGRVRTFMTPLLVALVLIEFTDLVFAVDSVPAIFAITKDPYIVYTSNIFAILGLRALYFALAAIIDRFYYIKFALAAVLVFIGSKVFIAKIWGLEKFPPAISLSVTFGLLAFGCVYSLYKPRVPKVGI
jgi:tellurite resistance protein TerC